uniref:Uncharacterized protein n=1 Tax=Arion vulgaris TaxID=1028688 RepID=A0A0B7BAV7_9EUPU
MICSKSFNNVVVCKIQLAKRAENPITDPGFSVSGDNKEKTKINKIYEHQIHNNIKSLHTEVKM